MARRMTAAEGRAMAAARWERERQAGGELEGDARRRLLRAKADKAELEVRVRRGELVERAKVERLTFAFARGLRDTLTAWPPRVAAEIAARLGADPHAVEAALKYAVRQLLIELADRPVPDLASGGRGEPEPPRPSA